MNTVKNTGNIEYNSDCFCILNNKWYQSTLYENYDKKNIFNKKNIFWLKTLSNTGIHIRVNWWNKQKLYLMYNNHWFQQEKNIRYIINIIFLLFGLIIGIMNINCY